MLPTDPAWEATLAAGLGVGGLGGRLVSAAAARLLSSLPDLWENLIGALQRTAEVWDFQLTAIDGRPLTVGKLTVALVVLVVGIPIARLATRRVSRRLFARIGLEEGAAAAFETLAFYGAVLCLGLLALWVAEIPLTVFTLAGGAVAIGIGFGSQKIVNNFISGLILLAERPIKVGDLIEVGETFGRVESIGARSTKIKSFDNFHIIVPNGAFLEQNVVNWTHSDNLVRVRLQVGVAYGSPTRRVEELILAAVRATDHAVIPPEPVVIFEDFGDSSLVFEALFWIIMKQPMDRRRALSAVRFRIDELFHEEGITIAFPQHDIHLDSPHPLQVRLLERDSE
jgi:potassium-dependent mechanosensitive channel